MERQGQIETYIEGPRWALPEGTVRKMVMDVRGVTLDYERRVTGLLTATIFFKVRGGERGLIVFRDAFLRAIKEANGE